MLLPVIMAGGTGSRLWPMSRELYPKQFLRWPQLSCIYLFFNFIINKLNQTSSLFNFSFMRLFLSHSPAKRAALLAV